MDLINLISSRNRHVVSQLLKRKNLARVGLLGLGLLAGSAGFAQETGPNEEIAAPNRTDWRKAVLDALDIRVEEAKAAEPAMVTATIDRAGLLAGLPVLQEHGLLSRNITREEFDRRPMFHANAIALQLTSWAVHDLYAANAKLDASRWSVFMTDAGDGQMPRGREMYSFGFDRKRYLEMDWATLSFAAFPIKAPGFSYNLRFTWDMARETSGGIAED